MLVGQLIDELKKFNQNRIVIMSSDAEGNRFSPVEQCDEVYYTADTPWSGEASSKQKQNSKPAIILWPRN